MLDEAIRFLRCPQCDEARGAAGGGALVTAGGSLRCDAGHTFDIARSGYVSLLPGKGDTAARPAK